jgi:hypothetical protein
MHQNSNNKQTYNTSGKSAVVVVKTKSQKINTFRIRTVEMPGKCIFKIGPERVRFRIMDLYKFHCNQTNYLEIGRCTRMTKLQQSHSKSNISPPGAYTK